MNRLKIILTIIVLISGTVCKAQRNFYHRLDVGSNNIYTFALSNLVTGYANYFSHDMLFDNSYVYTLYGGKINGEDVKTKGYNPMGLTASELFNDIYAGVKLGYQSDYTEGFNWGIYASGHYRINQIQAKFPQMSDYGKERFIYAKPGVGLLLTFGGIESDVKVQVEAAARYDFPIGYKGIMGTSANDMLNKGVSSHYSVKVAGYSWLSAGIFADICHYNLYKGSSNNSFKPYSFGVTFTITPKRGEDIYD